MALIFLSLVLIATYFFSNNTTTEKIDRTTAQQSEPKAATTAKRNPASPTDRAPTSTNLRELSSNITKPIPEYVKKLRKEIRTALHSAYAAQKATHAEFQHYSTDFHSTGFWYTGTSSLFNFKMGYLGSYFSEEHLSPEHGLIESTEDLIGKENKDTQEKFKYGPYAENIDFAGLKKFCKKNCTASADFFEFISATNLDKDDTLDVWLIDETKNVQHVSDDLKD